MITPSILCPVDFSESSRGALRYGAVLAEHFGSRLVVMTATDPLLAEAAAMETSASQFKEATLDALQRFFAETIDRALKGASVAFEAAVGKPETEILRVARVRRVDLIVISSHGLTGFRKMFFGSTTERVLRETAVPVLIVPGNDRGPLSLSGAASRVRRVLAPVLLPPAYARQIAVSNGIAGALGVPALLLHVVEPLRAVLSQSERHLAKVERERRARAEAQLEQLAPRTGAPRVEGLMAYGEPSEEIAKVARDRGVGLIVMGLNASPLAGSHIGSVTYRVLSAAGCLVLALPPSRAPKSPVKARFFSRRPKKAPNLRRTRRAKWRVSSGNSRDRASAQRLPLRPPTPGFITD